MNDKIFLKGVDRTSDVQSICKLENGKYEVVFYGERTTYTYSPDKVAIKTLKRTIDGGKYIVQINGKTINDIKEIREFDDFYQLILQNGSTKYAFIKDTNLIGSCLEDEKSAEKFNYFKEIVNEVDTHMEGNTNMLNSYYSKIQFIRDDTVLADYLRGKIKNNYQGNDTENIFPFGFNPSQKIATENAMNHKISIIQGPPGTGKTQTILNIIANVVKNNKTIAVVSNNNSAINNISEKLQECGVEFIAAKLGNTNNKEEFILNQHRYKPSEEKLKSWLIDKYLEKNIENKISILTNQINEVLNCKNKMAKLSSEFSDIETEKRYFDEFDKAEKNELTPLALRKFVHSNTILDLWLELEKIEHKINKLPLLKKIKFYLIYKVKIDDFFKQSYSNMIRVIQKLYYDTRINEIKSQIKKLSNYIETNDIDKKILEHKTLSQDIFQLHIAKRYLNSSKREYSSIKDIRKNSEDFIKDYPVVLSTTYSLRNSLDYNYVYDYVVIDESSQVNLATFVLVLSCAKRAVIVGDEKQLSNIVEDEVRKADEIIFGKYNISNNYKFSIHNALSSISTLFNGNVPSQLLYEHYRCHPKIIGFCNKSFYDNQLIILTKTTENARIPLKIYKTAKGNHARKNLNQREIDVTFDEVINAEKLDLHNNTVGIVTPYRNQAGALNKELDDIGAAKTTLAATVDKFQGRERDVIIINTVDNKISNFTSKPNRLNVAVSRAKNQLIVVTNDNDHQMYNSIGELIEYVKYNNFEVIKSSIYSVFDYLYVAYYKRRKIKKISYYDSENLMFELIEEVIKKEGYTNLKCVTHYPLKMLCDISKLSGREYEYAANNLTSIDFVLFKKTSKMPVLAIEVDGWAYHHANTVNSNKQKERDLNKNNILEKFNIPLIRFSTTGSSEYEKLSKKLSELMGE